MIPFLFDAVIPADSLWYWLLSAIGFPVMILVVCIVVGVWGIMAWRTPQEAKQITKAKNSKKPVVFFFNDAGQGWFEPLQQVNASGGASTTKKIDKQKGFLGFFPRKKDPVFKNPTADLEGEVSADNLAEYVDSLQTTKIYLKNAKIPIHVAYTGKALITSFNALAGVELAQKMALTDGGQVTEACPYCGQNKVTRRVIEKLELNVVNITRFFKNIGKLMAWDESQERGIAIEQFEWGREEEKRKANKSPMLMLILALAAMFGLAVMLVVVAYVLK